MRACSTGAADKLGARGVKAENRPDYASVKSQSIAKTVCGACTPHFDSLMVKMLQQADLSQLLLGSPMLHALEASGQARRM